MQPELTAGVVFALLLASIWFGILFRRLLPEDHFNADTKECVKLAMGLVATMTALLLGLLVSSAKGSYDANRGYVIQMAAKVTLLDRALELYGPETTVLQSDLRAAVWDAASRIWPNDPALPAQLAPDKPGGDKLYEKILSLAGESELHKNLRTLAANLAVEIGQFRALLMAQSIPSVSMLLHGMVVLWLVVIFFCFSLIAPANKTSALVLVVSALSVAGAVMLLLELDRPFDGLVKVSGEPLFQLLHMLARGS